MDEMAVRLGTSVDALVQARGMINKEGTSCVVIRDGEIIHAADGRGVSPLMALYQEGARQISGSCVVDRVIGKAAAMILVLAKAQSVYGEIMSLSAQEYLAGRGIAYQYGVSVETIANQAGTGICPIESAVLEIDDPEAGFGAIVQRISELQKAAG